MQNLAQPALEARLAVLTARQGIRTTQDEMRFETLAQNLHITETEILSAVAPVMRELRTGIAGPPFALAVPAKGPVARKQATLLGMGVPPEALEGYYNDRVKRQLEAVKVQAADLQAATQTGGWSPLRKAFAAFSLWRWLK